MTTTFTIRYKLYLIVIVPLLVLAFYSLNLFIEKKVVLNEMVRIEKLSHFALKISDLVHEIQKERGASSLLLASKEEDFSTKLSKQRLLTDEKYSDLTQFLGTFEEEEFGKEFQEKLQTATASLKNLNAKRNAIDSRTLSLKDSINYFTVVNHNFLEIIESMFHFSTMSETGNMFLTYHFLQDMKEHSGIIRAILSTVFPMGTFEPGLYLKFMESVNEVEFSKKRFLYFASPECKAIFFRESNEEIAKEVDRMQEIAIEKGIKGGFEVDPKYWFEVKTKEIDNLGKVVILLSREILEVADTKYKEARYALIINISLSLIAILFAMVVMRNLVRNITKRQKSENELHRYKHIVLSSTDMMSLLDKEFRYLSVNTAYIETFGKSRSDFIGHTVSEVFGKEFFDNTVKPNALNCLAGNRVNFQSWIELPIAGRSYMDVYYYPYIGTDNEIRGFAVNIRDITEHKRAKETLRKAFDESSIGMSLINSDGDFVNVNISLSEVTGYTKDDLLTMNITDLCFREDIGYFIDNFSSLNFEEKNKVSFDTRWTNKNGERIWVSVDLSLLAKSIDNEQEIVAQVQDITKHKQAQDELWKSEEKYRRLMDDSGDAIMISDMEGNILEANKKMQELTDCKKEDLLSTHFNNFYPKEELERHLKVFKEASKNETSSMYDGILLRKDGKRIDVDIRANVISYMDRKVVQCIFRDITEQKQAEKEIWSAKQKYESLVNHTSSVIYTLSPSGELTFISNAVEPMTGYSFKRFFEVSNMFESLIEKEDLADFRSSRDKLIQDLSPSNTQYRLLKKDGTYVWVNDKCIPVFAGNGDVDYFHCLLEDVTKIKELDQLKNDFLQTVVHDMKSPITGIKLELESIESIIAEMVGSVDYKEKLLMETYATSAKEKVKHVRGGLDSLYEMVTSLLKISEMDENKITLSYEMFLLDEVFKEVGHNFNERLKRKSMTLKITNLCENNEILCDRELIKRVLTNLVDNAIKYGDAFSTITVDAMPLTRTSMDCGHVMISIGR